jgi:hypothetical protein
MIRLVATPIDGVEEPSAPSTATPTQPQPPSPSSGPGASGASGTPPLRAARRRSSLGVAGKQSSLRALAAKAKNFSLVRHALRLLSITVDYNHLVRTLRSVLKPEEAPFF